MRISNKANEFKILACKYMQILNILKFKKTQIRKTCSHHPIFTKFYTYIQNLMLIQNFISKKEIKK